VGKLVDADPACDEGGGDGALGFQDTPPASFWRGAGGPGEAAGLFSNAAIRSRNEPGFGFAGGDESDIVVVGSSPSIDNASVYAIMQVSDHR
jgi:hypothetical protein